MSSVTESFQETFTESASTSASATASATATAGSNATDGEFVAPMVSISLKTPLLYLGILICTLVLFSIYHRRSKIQSLQKLTSTSLFKPSHEVSQDDISVTGTPTSDSTPAIMYRDLKTINAHDKMLKCALVSRAAESMRRIIKLKESEPSIMILYTRGLIGDDSYKRFKLQAKLQDAEMMEIAKEAESYKQGWSRIIFANAQEVMMNQALRRRIGVVAGRKEIVDKLEIKGVEKIVDGIQKRIIELK